MHVNWTRGNISNLDQPANNYRPSMIEQTFGGASHSAAGGSQNVGSAGSSQIHQQQSCTIPAHIFAQNIGPPAIEPGLPEPDQRLDNTQQLVCCLGLLKAAQSLDIRFKPIALKWLQTVQKDTEEKERLNGMALDVIRAFKREEIKDAKVVAEVVRLASILDKNTFHDLLGEFYSGVDSSGLLKFQQLEGLAQLIQGADQGHLSSDDLVKILRLLSARLMDTHQQSSQHMYQLTAAVSHVLDAMADTKVTELDRQKLHEPLSSYLSGLKKSSDPFLVYQAAYANQALLCVPDDETIWQAAMRRTWKLIQGVSGLVCAAKALDFDKLIQGLENIQIGCSGASKIAGAMKTTYSELIQGAKFVDSIKEGFSFERKRDWYSALRGADVMIQDGELATFKRLVCEAPCRYDPAFQWGVCQRLGEMAANPAWDADTHQSAIAFLGEIYKNDAAWGQQASVSQWILNILLQLSSKSGETSKCMWKRSLTYKVYVYRNCCSDLIEHILLAINLLYAADAKRLLRELETSGDTKKQALYQECRENGLIPYPLKVASPEFASPSLLDRVQDRPDVEGSISALRKRRTMERNDVYIPPQAKPSLQSPDDTRFPLMDKVREFLESDRKVLLLLGDSGAGKSTFSRELEYDLWQSYQSKTGRIPLHIYLPTINKPEDDMIAKKLRRDEFSELQIREMRHHRRFILICDGFDECKQTHNLYMSNRLNQPGEWDIQMVICCRIEHLGSDYRDQFQPRNRNQLLDSPLFQEAVFTPFSIDQIQDYVEQYVSIHKPRWQVKDYMDALDLTPTLKDLVKNPFLMTLSLEVLPHMEPDQRLSSGGITRVALYDLFVEQWLERGKRRLAEKDMSSRARAAYERLTAEGFTLNGIEYIKKLAVAIYNEQDGRPVVDYSRVHDAGSWYDAFFLGEDKQLLREACPLSRNGDQYRFIHRSVLEYGLARAVSDPKDRKNRVASRPALGRRGSMSSAMSIDVHGSDEEIIADSEQEPDPNSPLAWRSFVDDHSLLQFLAERLRQVPMFEERLRAYIEHSKKDKKWDTAAANAITILVRAGVQFIGANLRGIRIPGADLSYGVFHSVQLQGADMRKVNLRGAWLRQTDLCEADMTGVQFGELPYLSLDHNVLSCIFSPDGETLAIGLVSGDISVYSISNSERIQTMEGHDDAVTGLAFPVGGKRIVSGSWDKTVRIWDMESGVCQHVLTDHTGSVFNIAYSAEKNQVASTSEDKTIRLWDLTTNSCCQILSGNEKAILCVAYSPRGDQIASGSDDFSVRLWSIATGKCSHVLGGHSGEVWSIAFSPHGDQVASAGWDNTIRLWDVESGICRHILEGHTGEVNGAVYSPKGDQIFSASQDGTLRVWDVKSGTCRHISTGHGDTVYCVAYSKGDMVASGSGDKTVRLWDVSVRGSQHISSGHSKDVSQVKCSPNGKLIASCSADRTVRLWDVETGACFKTLSGHSNTVFGVAFSPRGNQLCSGSCDKTVRLWNVDTGTCQHILTGHGHWVHSVAYSPQGDQIASASEDKTVQLRNATTGEHCGILSGHTDGVRSVAYSPDGSLIATGSMDYTVRVWNVGSMACTNILKGHSGWVNDVVFSPGGDQLASASTDGTVRLRSMETGDCFKLTGHNLMVTRVAYSYKGDLLASASWDKTVRLWDVASGQCRAVVRNFQGSVHSVSWIPFTDANYLVTGCQDGSVVKWQVIEEEGQHFVHPCWIATNGALNVTGASIRGARGLNLSNRTLLRQRGAEGELGNQSQEANTIHVAHMVSQHSSDCMEQDSTLVINLLNELQQQADWQLVHHQQQYTQQQLVDPQAAYFFQQQQYTQHPQQLVDPQAAHFFQQLLSLQPAPMDSDTLWLTEPWHVQHPPTSQDSLSAMANCITEEPYHQVRVEASSETKDKQSRRRFTDEQLRYIKSLRGKDPSYQKIAKELGCSKATVWRLMKNAKQEAVDD